MSSPAPSSPLELVLEPAVTPSGPLLWSLRQQLGADANVMTGKRTDMVKVMGDTLNARRREGHTIVAKVYDKDGSLSEHVQYNPDGTGKKLPISAKAAEGFGRKCSTLGAPEAQKPGKKASAGKLLGELRAALEAVTSTGKGARRKAMGVLKRAKEADLGNGASAKRDELVTQLEAALGKLEGAGKKPKTERKKAGSGKPMTEYQTFFANRAPVLRGEGLDNKAVMARIGVEWNALKAAGKVGNAPKKPKAKKEKAAKPRKMAGGWTFFIHDDELPKTSSARLPKAAAAAVKKLEGKVGSLGGAQLSTKTWKEWPAGAVVVMQETGQGFYIHGPIEEKAAKAEGKKKAEKKPVAKASDGLETYKDFAARRLPALAEKHGHKEAMVKLGEEWQLEKAARRQTASTGTRPRSAPPAVVAPTKPASKSNGTSKNGGNGKGKPAALPDDPNVAQLALFLKGRSAHAST